MKDAEIIDLAVSAITAPIITAVVAVAAEFRRRVAGDTWSLVGGDPRPRRPGERASPPCGRPPSVGRTGQHPLRRPAGSGAPTKGPSTDGVVGPRDELAAWVPPREDARSENEGRGDRRIPETGRPSAWSSVSHLSWGGLNPHPTQLIQNL